MPGGTMGNAKKTVVRSEDRSDQHRTSGIDKSPEVIFALPSGKESVQIRHALPPFFGNVAFFPVSSPAIGQTADHIQ